MPVVTALTTRWPRSPRPRRLRTNGHCCRARSGCTLAARAKCRS